MKTYRSPESPKNPGMAKAWIAFCTSPEAAQDELAHHLDALLKDRLPDGRCQGAISGQEDEIRQEAYLLLVRCYLAGNPALFEATVNLDENEIAEQIQRSARASLTATKRSMKKAAIRRAKAHDEDTDVDAVCGADHPANRGNLWALPFEVQRALVFSILRRAADENLLPQRSLSVVGDMLDSELTQSLVAKARGISRQSVHQHLARVREVLKREMSRTEFPITSDEAATISGAQRCRSPLSRSGGRGRRRSVSPKA
jgi:DNA-directed RNA polymerase specialized sigma24 family protein